jgi:hypothetical protein
MPHPISNRTRPVLLSVLALVLASLLLAACGSSSSGTTTTTTSASSTTSTTGAPGSASARVGRFAAVRECLQKAGITLPKRSPGQGGGGFLAGGGPQLPKGVTRAQYEAAIKKCGGFGFKGGRFSGTARFSSPQFKGALVKFASCMRENGVNLPTPNSSGKGPIFNTKGLSVTSPKFKTAQQKCASTLRAAYPGVNRGAGPGQGQGAPPSAG